MKREEYRIRDINFYDKRQKQLASGAYYSFFFILSGNCRFYEDGVRYSCGFEDMFLMKPGTRLTLERINSSVTLRLCCVQYSSELLEALSDGKTCLERDLLIVPYTCTTVRCGGEILLLCKNLSRRLLTMEQERSAYANDIFERSILSMLMVLILRACIHAEFKQRPSSRKVFLIDDLFAYIHSHLAEEITLDQLEERFFVSKYHILREFKKATGQTLHSYIVKNKLELCQRYIAEGLPVKEVYQMGGFGGYNHFFQAFKKQYGMTPREYYKSTLKAP